MSAEESLTPIVDALQPAVMDALSDILGAYGGLVQSFVIGIHGLDNEGEPMFLQVVAPDQRLMTTSGLVEVMRIHAEQSIIRSHFGDQP